MKINEKIRQLREQHHLSQENMAEKLGMSVTGYTKIERGLVRSNLPRLEQISEVFDMDICELLSFGESEKVHFNNSSNDSINSNNANHFLFAVGDENLEKMIQQLQLMLKHKDELLTSKEALLAQQEKVIKGLEREIELLRKYKA